MPRLLLIAGIGTYKPAFIVTSGWLATDPESTFFSMGVCKAAQQNIVHNLHGQMTGKGVHCALAMVNGRVHPNSNMTNPENIAERCWELYSTRGNGSMDLATVINENDDAGAFDAGLATIQQWNIDHSFEM